MNELKNNFKQEEHYFKVNSKILEISNTKDLKKSELLVYLHHCRAINPRGRFLNCSVVGNNALSTNLKLDDDVINKATQSLIDKHFIEERADIKTGFYKTVAKKVLPFPIYNADKNNRGVYSPSDSYNGSYIQLPSKLIDDKVLNAELDRQLIFSILFLYSLIDWNKYWGVNYKLIKCCNRFKNVGTFGEGYNEKIYLKTIYQIETNNLTIDVSKNVKFKHGNLANNIEKLLELGIFEVYPVLFNQDNDEPDILHRQYEIFPGLIKLNTETKNNKKYRFSISEKVERPLIYSILKPVEPYIVHTPDYFNYIDNHNTSKEKQAAFYTDYDFLTAISRQKELLNTSNFWGWLSLNYEAEYKQVSQEYFGTEYKHDYFTFYETKNRVFTDEYMETTILPNIDNAIKLHYYNYYNKLQS